VLLSFRAHTPEVGKDSGHEHRVREGVPVVAELLRARGYCCEFYSQVNEDAAFVASLAKTPGAALGLPARTSLRDVGRLAADYADVELVVSNRLHVLLIAAASGCLPVAAVAREHHKIRDLFEAVGWGALIVDLDSPSLANQLAEVLDRAPELRTLVAAGFARARMAAQQNIMRMVAGC
jgi:hypothetical protein